MRSVARDQCKVFKTILVIIFAMQVIDCVSSFQRGNVQFPSIRQSIFREPSANVVVPIITNGNANNPSSIKPNEQNNNAFAPSGQPVNEFLVGTTGIACDSPGMFVKAPDGCNRCLCAENLQLSTACSRAFCPPGFPSSTQGQFRL